MAGVAWRGASLRVGFATAVRIAWRSAAAPPVYAVRLPRRSSPSPATQQPQREEGGWGREWGAAQPSSAARRAREVHWSNGDPVRVTEPDCCVWRSRYLPTS